MTTEEELDKLKKDYQKLKQKLNGVRKARTRDLAKANERLRNEIASHSRIIQSLLDRKAETRANRLNFIIWHIRDALIESKLTRSEWEDFFVSAIYAYKRRHQKGDSE